MESRHPSDDWFDSELSAKEDKKREWQKWKNNLLGIFVLLIIIAFAFDIGGVATSLSRWLVRG